MAVAVLACALVRCVDEPTEQRVRANAYLRAGEAHKALEEIDRGLSALPRDVPLLILRGKALFELERYGDARTAYEDAIVHAKALALEPRSLAEAHVGIAAVAMRQKDWQLARAKFAELVSINEHDADAHLNLSRVCLQLKEFDCAVPHAEAAGRIRGSSEEVLFTLGRIYTAAKKFDEANKTFAHIAELIPNAASSPYGLAIVAAQKGEFDVALAKLADAVNKKLPNPDRLSADPLLAPLLDDPRFKALVAKSQ